MRDVVVLLSGGLDSTVVAASALADGCLHSCVSVRYGQPNMEAEMMASRKWCDNHEVKREVIVTPMPGSEMRTGIGTPGPRVLPGRNLLMIALAVQYAAAVGARTVRLGACKNDADDYPDCRMNFIDSIGAQTLEAYGVSVTAPLIHMPKAAIVREARRLGVDISATWSCYEPRPTGFTFSPCGSCNACRARAEGMRLAVQDHAQ